MTIIVGGVEGGASKSFAAIFNEAGELIGSADGPGTNFWIEGKEEARNRMISIIKEARKKANLPEDIKINCMCLSMSGAEDDIVNEEFQRYILEKQPEICEKYIVCSDTIGPIAVAHDGGGAVLIAGTGSNALLVNADGSQARCGGWGHILGDEGSAFWISRKAMKICFDDIDGFELPPKGFSTQIVWETIKTYFNINERFDLLGHVYKENMKSHVAGLCQHLAKKAQEGDPLSKWLFEKAGKDLAKHLQVVARGADPALIERHGGLPVVCVGSVWKSWLLMKPGFVDQLRHHPEPALKEASLITLKTSVATGAAYLAAKHIHFDLPRDYSKNISVFYHYVSD